MKGIGWKRLYILLLIAFGKAYAHYPNFNIDNLNLIYEKGAGKITSDSFYYVFEDQNLRFDSHAILELFSENGIFTMNLAGNQYDEIELFNYILSLGEKIVAQRIDADMDQNGLSAKIEKIERHQGTFRTIVTDANINCSFRGTARNDNSLFERLYHSCLDNHLMVRVKKYESHETTLDGKKVKSISGTFANSIRDINIDIKKNKLKVLFQLGLGMKGRGEGDIWYDNVTKYICVRIDSITLGPLKVGKKIMEYIGPFFKENSIIIKWPYIYLNTTQL